MKDLLFKSQLSKNSNPLKEMGATNHLGNSSCWIAGLE
jgi:hypothetical protein